MTVPEGTHPEGPSADREEEGVEEHETAFILASLVHVGSELAFILNSARLLSRPLGSSTGLLGERSAA